MRDETAAFFSNRPELRIPTAWAGRGANEARLPRSTGSLAACPGQLTFSPKRCFQLVFPGKTPRGSCVPTGKQRGERAGWREVEKELKVDAGGGAGEERGGNAEDRAPPGRSKSGPRRAPTRCAFTFRLPVSTAGQRRAPRARRPHPGEEETNKQSLPPLAPGPRGAKRGAQGAGRASPRRPRAGPTEPAGPRAAAAPRPAPGRGRSPRRARGSLRVSAGNKTLVSSRRELEDGAAAAATLAAQPEEAPAAEPSPPRAGRRRHPPPPPPPRLVAPRPARPRVVRAASRRARALWAVLARRSLPLAPRPPPLPSPPGCVGGPSRTTPPLRVTSGGGKGAAGRRGALPRPRGAG
ncbi:translation initiation factor IF-2-like [Moschus berezovskii]|uniref:translation initiation factor IF-2-like n=1 Tax=Moschus berezovskii TaxID=68408 RepID=UPI002443F242|nr:translation initiation factor IF-2-like [Moschus berezovskii]